MADPHDRILARRHRMEHLELYDVSGDELDQIERVAGSVGSDLQFATFWLPIGVTSLLTLLILKNMPDKVYISYFCIVIVSFALGLYFLIRWFMGRGELKKCIGKIRERQVGPVGQQGKELKPSDLALLQPISPGAGEEQK